MKRNSALVSKIAAAALTLGMALPLGAALAQDTPVSPEPVVAENTAQAVMSNYSIGIDPHLPLTLILALGGIYGIATLYAGGTGLRGSFGRAAVGVVLGTALVNPYILEEQRAPLATEVAVVVDRSASQGVSGRDAVTTAATEELLARLQAMEGVNVRTIEAGGPRNGVVTDGTDLFAALSEGLTDVMPDRLGAVIMVTDGQVHDAAAARLPDGVPLHVILTGGENERDRRVVLESAPAFGVVGEEQVIRFRVEDDGAAPATGPVRVDISADGEVIATQFATPGQSTEAVITLPRPGTNVVTVQAETLAGELTAANNTAAIEVKGVRDRLRVLLVSGAPTAGERALRTLLKSDPSTDLVHFTILRPPGVQDPTPLSELAVIAYPTRELFEERINDFDMIILDHYEAEGTLPFLYYENMAQYVERGGAMMIMAGPDYAGIRSLNNTPLSRILPATPTGNVTNEPFRPGISDTGLRHPVTRDLPGARADDADAAPAWGRWFRLVDTEIADGASVVMTGAQDKPLVVLNREGEGRIGMVLSDHAWLWARGYEEGGPYAELLGRVSHWLLQEPALEEEALRLSAQAGQLTVTRQTLADSVAPVTITAPTGTTQNITMTMTAPGQWTATVDIDQLGLYRATQDDQVALANAGPAAPREFADLRATSDILAPIVTQSGGMIAPAGTNPAAISLPRIVTVAPQDAANTDAPLSGPGWLGLRMSEATDLKGTARYPLMAGWLAFALIIGLMAASWLREGEPGSVRRMIGLGGRKSGPGPAP